MRAKTSQMFTPQNQLKIGFFNINVFVGQTTYNSKFSEVLQKFDILCIGET